MKTIVEEKWYKNEKVWMAIILVTLAVSVSLIYQQTRQRQSKSIVQSSASRPAIKEEIKIPRIDIPGAHDFKDIGRPPNSVIIWQKQGTIAGLKTKTIKYISSSPPQDMQLYFTDKLLDNYSIVRDSLATSEGHGWTGIFLNRETNEVITVVSTSKRIGPSPGGKDNPTEVSVMRVGRKTP